MRIEGPASQLTQLTQLAQPTQPSVRDSNGDDFGQMLMDALKEVNATQRESRELQNSLMAGQPVEFHDLMIAMERASVSMQLTMQVRNKLLEAYQEMSRMQV